MIYLLKSKRVFFILIITLILGCNSKRKFHTQCKQTPKYYKKFKLPEKIIGYNNYEQAVDCAKKINKPLAVYFTAMACKNCRKFEADFLNSNEVSTIINENFVFVELFVDDKTELPKEDQFIETSYFSGKKRRIKNIGHLNNTLLPKYMHSSQPALFITDRNNSILSLINYDLKTKNLITELKSAIGK